MFSGLQKLVSILLSGIIAFNGTPIAFAQFSSEVGETVEINGQVWKTAPIEARIGGNENVQNEKQESERKLTIEQMEEIAKLAGESLEKRKQIIDKYVEYGVISKERGEKIKASMDQHFERMKEHNFIPFFHKYKKEDKCNCKD